MSVSKKIDFVSDPGGSKPGGQLLHPMFLCDRALKLHVGMGSDSKICLILSYKSWYEEFVMHDYLP